LHSHQALPEFIMTLINPHGGELKELFVAENQREALKAEAGDFPSWDLNQRQLCDLEMLLEGSFSPLTGFLNKADYAGVLKDMRLADGTIWPMPITLDVSEAFAEQTEPGTSIALRDMEGVIVAVLDIEDSCSNPVYLGGKLRGLQQPTHYDFRHLRRSPREMREEFAKLGWSRVVAFQTRNPMHRAHQELTFRAALMAEANLLIHPVVGLTKPGDIDHMTRVRCYEKLLQRFPEQTTELSLLNLAMRMGGPREALWHAIIRKNHGCTHIIIGRDHAGPGKDRDGNDFYGPYDAQEMVAQYQEEIGVEMVPFKMMVYVQDRAQYVAVDEVEKDEAVLNISGTELRRRLQEGLDIPDWFSYPEVVEELRKSYPPRNRQGFTVFFTGLSGAGKSTIANALMVRLLEMGDRPVSLLDGDIVRKHLSSELGFSKEHRNINVLRIGFVASEITKNSGVAICAPIAPYLDTRRQVREMIEPLGGFIEVHVSTSLAVCEQRDRKGLYALARAGKIKEFTGISDPYDEPEHPEMRIDTDDCSPEEAVQRIILKLEQLGLISISRDSAA
jgi:sulfate adenylyltransferase